MSYRTPTPYPFLRSLNTDALPGTVPTIHPALSPAPPRPSGQFGEWNRRKISAPPAGLRGLGYTLADLDSSLPAWDLSYVAAGAAALFLMFHLSKSSRSAKRTALYKARERAISDEARIKAQ